MKIPNYDHRFEDVMSSIVELCVCSIEPSNVAFVCLPGEEYNIHRKIADFMSGKSYGVSHYVSALRGRPILSFENKSHIDVLAKEDDWLGRSLTEIVMFCRFDELTPEIRICMGGCIYSSKPMLFSLLSINYNHSIGIKKMIEREERR